MSYLEHFRYGNLILPSGLLFHYSELFTSSEEFLVWQFFFLQNTTKRDDLAPSQIASALGKSLSDVNRMISNLTTQGLLDTKTIDMAGEIEVIFDASPALEKLDTLTKRDTAADEGLPQTPSNAFKDLVKDFERELGRFLSPFEIEELQKTIDEDNTDPEVIRLALREAVLNGKINFKYINAILRNWRHDNLRTVRQVKERLDERNHKQTKEVPISDDFLSAINNLWMDD
ncbi:DnaD domain-containing protein [Streptococcus sciuri]|uniref:DnaD domain-containing protein n=1 Tax=Streptococcus sciuri TaxID=2973939 RepID=A0ABT2F5D5_9STRE|nr:DnaD domain-containing protein [Streptococcus sciuri]MCS4487393.1 DnaD domain-containing protein [Streptococcus sciuri]